MPGICGKIKGDKSALRICERLVEDHGLGIADFDVGVPHIVRPEGKDSYVEPGKPNSAIEPPEIYAKAIDVAWSEEDENRARVQWPSPESESEFSFSSPFHKFLSIEEGVRIPWLFDDLKEDRDAELLFQRVVKKAAQIKNSAAYNYLDYNGVTPGYRRDIAMAIFDFIRKSPEDGGLGIESDREVITPERDLVETAKSRKATCIEFANLYIAIARQAGLTVRPIEAYTDKKGLYIDHAKVAVELGNGETLFFCLYDGVGLSPKEKWSFISMNDLMAHDYNARSILDCPDYGSAGAIKCQKSYLERALDFSPHHYMAFFNMGFLYYNKSDLETSLEYYLKSRDEYPDNPNVRYDLDAIYRNLGKYGKAEKECEAYKTLTGKDSCD